MAVSYSGSNLRLPGPYPITGPLHHAGVLWREEFGSTPLVYDHGGVPIGVPVIDRGVVLNGTTQRISYGKRGGVAAAFQRAQQFWIVDFAPDFASDDGVAHHIFDASGLATVSNYTGLRKDAADALIIRFANTDISIAHGVYGGSWNVGERNRLIVSLDLDTPSHDAWLNGTQILTADGTALTLNSIINFVIGADVSSTSWFDGALYRVMFGNGTVTLVEALSILED